MSTFDNAYFLSRDAFIHNDLTNQSSDDHADEDCYVCLEPYRLDDMSKDQPNAENPVRLSCGHVVGLDCILRWTLDRNTCPLCRAILFDPVKLEATPQASFGTTDLEAIVNWEHAWYEAMGIEPRYVPIGALHDHFGIFCASPNDNDNLILEPELVHAGCACGISEHGTAAHCRHSSSAGRNHRSIDALQSALVMEQVERLLQQTRNILSEEGCITTAASQQTNSPPIDTGLIPDTQFEQEIKELDTCMGYLKSMHDEWMDEYTSAMESEHDAEDELF